MQVLHQDPNLSDGILHQHVSTLKEGAYIQPSLTASLQDDQGIPFRNVHRGLDASEVSKGGQVHCRGFEISKLEEPSEAWSVLDPDG